MCAFTTADFAPESDTSRSFCRADCVSTLMFAPDSSRICFTVAPALPMIPPTWLFDSMILSVCVCAGVTPSAVAAVAPAALSGALDCSSSTSSMSSAALLSPRGEPVTLISRSVAPCTSSLMEILEPDCSRMPLMLMPPFPMIVPCGGRRSSESGRVRDPGPRAE